MPQNKAPLGPNGCYVIRNAAGEVYRSGLWVNEPPYEIFISPTRDLSTIQNIAQALGGEMIDLEKLNVTTGTHQGTGSAGTEVTAEG